MTTTTDLIPSLPDSPLARVTLDLVRSSESQATANHSVRTYLFGSMLADERGIAVGSDFDPRLLFLACVLHDMGMSEQGNRAQRFEVDGADVAAEFLTQQGLPATDVDLVWEAIALHTSPGIAERRGALAMLTRAGVGVDFGRDAAFLTDLQAVAVSDAYPRLGMATTLVNEIVAQATVNPEKAPRYSIAADLVRERAERGSTLLEDAAAQSRWGC